MSIKLVLTEKSLTIFQNGKQPIIVTSSSPRWGEIVAEASNFLRHKDWSPESLLSMASLKEAASFLAASSSGKLLFDGKGFRVAGGGFEVPQALSDMAFKMLNERCSRGMADAFCEFIENLMQNPSKRSVDSLMAFIEKWALPISPDGHFYALKSVRKDRRDYHSGTIVNSDSALIQMPRAAISDDPDHACHQGLHVGSQEYVVGFGGDHEYIVVKINPKDVVCVPRDCNAQKMRVCEYFVLGKWDGKPFEFGVYWASNRGEFISLKGASEEQKKMEKLGEASISVSSKNGKTNKGWGNKRDSKGRFSSHY